MEKKELEDDPIENWVVKWKAYSKKEQEYILDENIVTFPPYMITSQRRHHGDDYIGSRGDSRSTVCKGIFNPETRVVKPIMDKGVLNPETRVVKPITDFIQCTFCKKRCKKPLLDMKLSIKYFTNDCSICSSCMKSFITQISQEEVLDALEANRRYRATENDFVKNKRSKSEEDV
ncbi:MAG: hypothetical protein ACTSUE_17890 [Promethearchaeota archaeon]